MSGESRNLGAPIFYNRFFRGRSFYVSMSKSSEREESQMRRGHNLLDQLTGTGSVPVSGRMTRVLAQLSSVPESFDRLELQRTKETTERLDM